MYLDRRVWANSDDPDQIARKDLRCLPFHLHLLEAVVYYKTAVFNFRIITSFFLVSEFFGFYCKFPEYSDTKKICCNHSKI